jgi:isopenicillin-N epimerase
VSDWALAPDVVHLNHGSYGGCPRAVLEASAAIRARLEAAPMRFFVLEWQAELDRARGALAEFVRAPDDRLAFLPNATTGVQLALASTPLATGDELLVLEDAYRACRNQLARRAAETGAQIVTVPMPRPFDPDQLVEAIARAVTPRTRIALLDHVTSGTAIVVPLERILPALAGITVIVDGAHAPGQLALDVGALLSRGVAWYAGNNHKWLCAPKSTGFVVAADPDAARPIVTSHGASAEYGPANRFHAELDWPGTHDPTAHLSVPAAIATIAELGDGWPRTIARNHALVLELCARLGGTPIAPPDSLGTMAAMPIELAGDPGEIQIALLRDGFEVPIVATARGPLLRVSAHLYNEAADADRLAAALRGRVRMI